VVTALMLKKTY